MKFDFGGYATKNDILCSDGRVIRSGAFKDQNGARVPFVWRHRRDEPENILGHAILEHRADGVYARVSLNESEKASRVKTILAHGDLDSLSIYAARLKQVGQDVLDGVIHEVSLVMRGANSGAKIDNVNFAHEDSDFVDDEADIYFGIKIDYLEHADSDNEDAEVETEDSEDSEETVGDVLETLSEKQKTVVMAMLAEVAGAVEESDAEDDAEHEEVQDTELEGHSMPRNVFDDAEGTTKTLSHEDKARIFEDARRNGSLKDVLEHADDYGIEDIEYLFPDARNLAAQPQFVKRRTEWVNVVLQGTKHTPFSRVKMLAADITEDDARARGYVKGNEKVDEVFRLLKRSIDPTTIYKKQKLDRDDVLDITDFDVVMWMKAEMRLQLDEEVASAILVGDGRSSSSPDKIDQSRLIPIAAEQALYAPITLLDEVSVNEFVDAVTASLDIYEGSGSPMCFMAQSTLTRILTQRNPFGDRMYKSVSEVADSMSVSRIVPLPDVVFARAAKQTVAPGDERELAAIVVNLGDYTVGADKGAQLGMFDDFDIDYNQNKYLLETRISGALTQVRSALRIYTSGPVKNNPANPLVLVGTPGDDPEAG